MAPENREPRRYNRDTSERHAIAVALSRRLIDVAARAIAKDLECGEPEARELLIVAVEVLQRSRR